MTLDEEKIFETTQDLLKNLPNKRSVIEYIKLQIKTPDSAGTGTLLADKLPNNNFGTAPSFTSEDSISIKPNKIILQSNDNRRSDSSIVFINKKLMNFAANTSPENIKFHKLAHLLLITYI